MASLDNTLGALEIGILVSTVLFGVATVQVYLYAEADFNDPLWVRSLVWIVWLLESAHTVFIWVLLYSLTVVDYGIPSTIDETPWSLVMGFPLASILGAIVQGYFAYRLRILSRSLIIPMISWSGAILRCAFGVALAVVPLRTKSETMPNFTAHYEWLLLTPMSINVFVDLLNTLTSCVYLLRQRSAFKETQGVIDKLIMYSVETGLITSLCAVAILTCVLLHQNLIGFGIFMFYPKLFSNSFLTSLNARMSLRQKCSQVRSTELSNTKGSLDV